MMGNKLFDDLFGIASLLIGVAAVALLINRASDTATVIKSAGDAFNALLQTVTLQNNAYSFGTLGSTNL